ncbi:MAG: hypothetical protein U0X92_19415 [Anaerolineales bacterium]
MSHEDELQSVLERVSRSEKTARQRSLLYSLIPILVGLAMILVTTQAVTGKARELDEANSRLADVQEQRDALESQTTDLKTDLNQTTQQLDSAKTEVDQLRQESQTLLGQLEKTKTEITELQSQRDNLNEQVELLSTQVEESGVLRNKFFEGDILVILKDMSADFPAQVELLEEILRLQSPDSGTQWLAGGVGPTEFDSPGFAAYLLSERGLITGKPEDNHYTLSNILPAIHTPENGDVVFYKGGYTMFYFQDPYTQESFVIGMTTFGIVAMKYDFAPLIGVGDVKYP